MFFPYVIRLNINAFMQQFCLANIHFIFIDVNIYETAIKKIDEITPVSCKRKLDFNNLWDQVS